MKKVILFSLLLGGVCTTTFAKPMKTKKPKKVYDCTAHGTYTATVTVTCPGTGEIKSQSVTSYGYCTKPGTDCAGAQKCADENARYAWSDVARTTREYLLSTCTPPQ